MDVERSSLCNCVVNFLLEENYLLTAFELLHELLDDGRDNQAIRLKEFFADQSRFPPDQISRFNSLNVADPQSLLEEKLSLEEKLALAEYELRLSQEDVVKLKSDLQKKSVTTVDDSKGSNEDASVSHESESQQMKRHNSFSDMGPLKDNERRDLNCAVKEYLLLAGYRLTAMTFLEEVTDQNLDAWPNSSASVRDALRHYYYQYLSSTTEAAEEKISMLRENESLKKEIDSQESEKVSLMKMKDIVENQVTDLTKSLEALQKDIKDKEKLVQDLKKSLEHQRKELNDCRAEITSLKMHIEGTQSGRQIVKSASDYVLSPSLHSYEEETKLPQGETEPRRTKSVTSFNIENYSVKTEDEEGNLSECSVLPSAVGIVSGNSTLADYECTGNQTFDEMTHKSEKASEGTMVSSSDDNGVNISTVNYSKHIGELSPESNGVIIKSETPVTEPNAEKIGLETIQILSDALPKIVPYVLINHREELLPLIMCAIERHPVGGTRDSLTHTLFNLIKRPDEEQRRVIMDACVTLAKNVGEMRTETELLPQCWEQINHMYEERRLLVAQSCGELVEYVRPEIRDSLILSIVQQLIEDPATVVREAAAHNLALLLPLFPNLDKYFKVEEMMFQLVCDPSGVVVDTTIKELVPSLVKWGNKLDHVLRVLLSHIMSSAQRCPPLSGVEGSVESHFRVLGERERWNIDVLLRLLVELLPFVHQKAIETCPFPSNSDSEGFIFSTSLLEQYARENVEWPTFEWLHLDCLPNLIQLASLLPPKEDNLRTRITRFLLMISDKFGESYLTHVMLPELLIAVGDNSDSSFFPVTAQPRLRALKPRTAVAERLASTCVLPILLSGVLGHPSKHEQLTEYFRNLLVQPSVEEGHQVKRDTTNSIRFLCTFEEHHNMIFNILWEMVASSSIDLKISATKLLKVLVPCIDAKVASTHVLPALVTLGSDQNLNVKYASIDVFGAVAQHFKNDMIVDKIRVQMDAFLEDGSHEATVAVVRALVMGIPHTTERLRDYILYHPLGISPPSSNDLRRRRERADAFCEAIRALDATDLAVSSVKDLLLPAIQNLLKDTDALDPAHKEALEIIMRERSGGTFDSISKVMGMGAHLGIASSVTSFFGEGGLRGKKDSVEVTVPPSENVDPPQPVQQPPVDDTRFSRMMRGGFADMLRGKAKGNEDTSYSK
ncbi:hypothetical protein LIER_00753 [Lithospermum erythrorhizon]|uniref:Uncharacterized protein n=1 Tax=Lithospermum erythrorhizon TaxID=34254 RepID=A0AAV3NJ05_LITER